MERESELVMNETAGCSAGLSGCEMTGPFIKSPDKLEFVKKGEVLRIEPFGRDTLRFRSTRSLRIADEDWNLLKPEDTGEFSVTLSEDRATVTNGNIKAEVTAEGRVTYYNSRGDILLREGYFKHDERYGRSYVHTGGSDYFKLHVTFEADKNEKLYGMGQYSNDCLDLKGNVLELAQKNTQISIPFLLSDRGYGFIWNCPSVGRAELSMRHTRFTASLAKQIDYVIIAKDSIAPIVRTYADLTGHAPEMPYFATGYWQSKLRYATQEELLGVAREYKKRNLPLSVIVADFYHWPHSGDWKFNEKYWPDPKAMVDELRGMGVELLVSVWPTVGRESENFKEMQARNFLINTEEGSNIVLEFVDNLSYVDVTHPEARKFFWNRCKRNYFDKGVRMFWLDEAEPEIEPLSYSNLRYYAGNGLAVSNMYPFCYAKAFYEGQRAEGQTEIINLARSGWIGSQRYGTLLWSGDIVGNVATFKEQIKAGLNISLCGIPWWNTDIGGFFGEPDKPEFRELLVRWFQYGTFCPVMRMHGFNTPATPVEGQLMETGSPNEVWSFGEEVYGVLSRYLQLRERLRPYIYEQMKNASKAGDPVMRPMFYDFPEDKRTYECEYQFMFGPDILVAPVTDLGVKSLEVYLPAGARWTDARTGKSYIGGQKLEVDVDLEDIPYFFRDSFTIR